MAGQSGDEVSRHKLARLGGILYLLLFPTAAPGILSGQTAMGDSAAVTLAGIQDGRFIFELFTVLGVIGFIDFLVLGYVLHRLFRPFGVI